MNREIPPSNNNKNAELETFLELYPLPEKHRDKGELALELKKINNSLLKKDAQKNNFENFTILGNFARNLRNKYKDAANHWTYNMLIGSTYGKEKTPSKFDFPEDDSIEKFLRLQELSSRLDD
ncbi:MAG: hypothetical protein AAB569_05955 [Patescibacteria group bacterium]